MKKKFVSLFVLLFAINSYAANVETSFRPLEVCNTGDGPMVRGVLHNRNGDFDFDAVIEDSPKSEDRYALQFAFGTPGKTTDCYKSGGHASYFRSLVKNRTVRSGNVISVQEASCRGSNWKEVRSLTLLNKKRIEIKLYPDRSCKMVAIP